MSYIRSERVVPLAVFLCALVLYVATTAPTVLWGDDAAFQRNMHIFWITYKHTSHPLWILISQPFKYIPFGDVAFRANCVSALFGALTLATIYKIAGHYCKSTASKLIAVAILGVSHTFWLHCVRAEVYTLNTFLFSVIWLSGIRCDQRNDWRWLIAASVVFVISLANHVQMLIAFPGFALIAANYVSRHQKRQMIIRTTIICTSIACLIIFVFPITRNMILETIREVWPPSLLLRSVVLGFGYIVYNMLFSLVLFFVGIVLIYRTSKIHSYAMITLISINCLFGFTFNVPAVYTFYLPAYVVMAVACAPAIEHYVNRWGRHAVVVIALISLLVPIIIYRVVPEIVNRFDMPFQMARDLPGRNAAKFFLWPPKNGYTGARDYAEAAMRIVSSNSLILGDITTVMALLYLQQVEEVRPDVMLVIAEPNYKKEFDYKLEKIDYKGGIVWILTGSQLTFLQDESRSKTAYLADTQQYYDVDEIGRYFDIVKSGPIYKLNRKRDKL